MLWDKGVDYSIEKYKFKQTLQFALELAINYHPGESTQDLYSQKFSHAQTAWLVPTDVQAQRRVQCTVSNCIRSEAKSVDVDDTSIVINLSLACLHYVLHIKFLEMMVCYICRAASSFCSCRQQASKRVDNIDARLSSWWSNCDGWLQGEN